LSGGVFYFEPPCSSVDSSPAFSEPLFTYLQETFGEKPCENECCLVIDGMSIRKDSHNSGKFVGHVDFGGIMEDSDKIAMEAVVFMTVGLSGRWKMPVAYFFTDHATAETQTNLVLNCITRLYDAEITVVLLDVMAQKFISACFGIFVWKGTSHISVIHLTRKSKFLQFVMFATC